MKADYSTKSSIINRITSQYDFVPRFSENYDASKEFNGNTYQCYAINLHDIQQFHEHKPGDSNIHTLETEGIKQKLVNHLLMKEMAETLLLTLRSSPPSNEIDAKIQEVTARIAHLTDEIEKEESRWVNIAELKGEFKERLKLPRFGMNKDFDPDKCGINCVPFGEIGDKTSLETFWKKICCFSEQQNLSEEGIKELLSGLLRGSAFDTFFNVKDKNLQTILQVLIDRYGAILTLADKLTKQ